MTRRIHWPAIAAAALLLASPVSPQDGVSAALQQARVYVRAFRTELANIVAEETYQQTVRTQIGVTITLDGRGSQPTGHRELKSDILMVRLADGYTEFRDVFAVDGSPVRDRQNRLSDLFLSGTREAGGQIDRLNQESARYNIGNVYRNFNTPAVALRFLEPEMASRFAFTLAKNRAPALATPQDRSPAAAFYVDDDVVVIEYKETKKPTAIQRLSGLGDMPSSGRYWIDRSNGAVVMSELVLADPLLRCTIDVAFGKADGVRLLVPREMRERYVDNRDHVATDGSATYDKVRRFQVSTSEEIPPVK